jgi:hypothetical protein
MIADTLAAAITALGLILALVVVVRLGRRNDRV